MNNLFEPIEEEFFPLSRIMKMSVKELYILINRCFKDISFLESQLKDYRNFACDRKNLSSYCEKSVVLSLEKPSFVNVSAEFSPPTQPDEKKIKNLNVKLSEKIANLQEKYESLTNINLTSRKNTKKNKDDSEKQLLESIRKENLLVHKILLFEICKGNSSLSTKEMSDIEYELNKNIEMLTETIDSSNTQPKPGFFGNIIKKTKSK